MTGIAGEGVVLFEGRGACTCLTAPHLHLAERAHIHGDLHLLCSGTLAADGLHGFRRGKSATDLVGRIDLGTLESALAAVAAVPHLDCPDLIDLAEVDLPP